MESPAHLPPAFCAAGRHAYACAAMSLTAASLEALMHTPLIPAFAESRRCAHPWAGLWDKCKPLQRYLSGQAAHRASFTALHPSSIHLLQTCCPEACCTASCVCLACMPGRGVLHQPADDLRLTRLLRSQLPPGCTHARSTVSCGCVQNHQIDQLKEEISGKDLALVKEHFDHMKVTPPLKALNRHVLHQQDRKHLGTLIRLAALDLSDASNSASGSPPCIEVVRATL